MDLFEKATWGLTSVGVVAVIVLIVVTSVVGVQLSASPYSDEQVLWEFKWANRGRGRVLDGFTSVERPDIQGRTAFGPSAPGGPNAPARAAARSGAARPGQPGRSNDGVGVGVERGPGAPADGGNVAFEAGGGAGGGIGGGWTQDPSTGVYEAPAVRLPAVLVEHYRHADQARSALNSAESWDINLDGQTAVQLGNVPGGSPLAEYLGLQSGDIVVAVNGYAVSRSNGMDLYQRLKNESKFRVEIQRGNARIIAKYEVDK